MRRIGVEKAISVFRGLSGLPTSEKARLLAKLRNEVDETTFRYLAGILSVNLSRADNPKRWADVGELAEVVDVDEPAELDEEEWNNEDVVEEEYVGQRVVEKIWKSNI